MSFKKWLKGYREAWHESLMDHAENHGLKMTKNFGALLPKGLDEKTLSLYTAYRNQRTTNMLVWATWVLAIGALILSGITLYSQLR